MDVSEMGAATIAADCREWFLDPEFARLRALRAETPPQHLVGCFPVYTPEEVVLAAGAVPVHVAGAGTLVEIDHADSRMQSFVCSVSRSTLELGLTQRFDMLDGILFPSICDVSRNLSGLWQRNFPAQLAEYLHLPENADPTLAVPYLRAELKRLEAQVTAITGRVPDDASYREAFRVTNAVHRLIADLYALRREAPWAVPLTDAYSLVRAGGMMPRERWLPLAESALADWRAAAAAARPQDRVRVVIEGAFCEQPSLELLQTIEEAGCYVVDDDFLLGQRWYTAPLPLRGDPRTVLARHVLERGILSAVHHPGPKSRNAALVAKVRAAGAHGVLFCMAKFCEPALYDYALLKRALEAESIPYLAFEFEEKMSTFENMRTQIETFVESILLFS